MIERSEMLYRRHRGKIIKKRILSDEQGFAAIIISIVLVVVLSLITVGFASLMRKEQRSALDRQLSNAAYYAAESGVNDAVGAVRAGFTATKDKCVPYTAATVALLPGNNNQSAATKYLMNSTVDNGSNTSYSCLIISPNPATLEYSSVPVNLPTTALLTGSDSSGNPATIDVLVFSWQDAGGGQAFAPAATPPGCPVVPGGFAFPSIPCWKDSTGSAITGVLRVGLTPIPPLGGLNRNSLETSSYTSFLYPSAGGQLTIPTGNNLPPGVPSDSYSGHTGASSGDIIGGSCNKLSVPRFCSVAVTNLGQQTYLMHLSSIYASTEVTVTPFNCIFGSCQRIYLKGAQTLIDSTGKAQDVLRRIQVRLPARDSFDYPEFSLTTGGPICKLLTTYPQNLATGTPGNTTNLCDPL